MSALPEGWVETSLGGVSSSKQYGYTESASTEKVGPKFLRITDIQHDFIDWNAVPYCPISEKNKLKYKLGIGDVVIARTGNSTGATATIKDASVDAVFASYLIRFKIDPQIADYNFIDFSLRSRRWGGFVKSVKGGSAQGGANANNFAEYPINLPPLPEQKAIADMLSSFDEKIELLREQNKTLETLAQTIFKEWFVHFNYPDATGDMVDSELGEIPKGWRVGTLRDVVDIFDSKRIPLSSNERQKRQGIYPYYGATKAMDYIDDYLFDGTYLLMAEDGSVMDDNGYPFLQYVWGKFWVNNHTHILQGKNGFSTAALYVFLKRRKVAGIVNGAVQLKINQTNLMGFDMLLPADDVMQKFNALLQPIFEKVKNNSSQVQELSKTRDALLPKLMSGTVRI